MDKITVLDGSTTTEKILTIELDCPPGGPRPGELLPGVLQGTNVSLGDPVSTFFGNWTWEIPNDQREAFLASRSVIADRIRALFREGFIRYGSW